MLFDIQIGPQARGGGNVTSVIDLEEGDLINGGLASRSWGHKATKVDLKRDVFTLALNKTLKGLMAKKGGDKCQEGYKAIPEERDHMC
jgi:hypothetical protein